MKCLTPMRLLPLARLPLAQVAGARSKASAPELASASIVIGKMVYLHKQSQILIRDRDSLPDASEQASTVNDKSGSCDKGRIVRSEVRNRFGDVFRFASASNR